MIYSIDYPTPVKFLTENMKIPNKTLQGPGPSNLPLRVRKAMSNPVLGHMHPETFEIMDQIKEGIKYLFQTNNLLTLCLSASGHGGMEAAFCNLIEDDDVVLIANCGFWAERAKDMSKRLNADVREMKKNPGDKITVEELREQFKTHQPKMFFIAHGESSTGQLYNLEGFGELCREFNCLFIVDTVITLGCVPLYIDKWKIDVAYSGSQKCLNAPPGITPITFNSRAIEKVKERKSPIKSYYFDILMLAEYWKCFEKSQRIYHHTISTNLLYGLREAIGIFIEQGGLEKSWRKHRLLSRQLYDKLEVNGFKMYIEDVECRCPSVTSVVIPQDINSLAVMSYAMTKYKFEIAGGLGLTAAKIFRIGLMGANANKGLVEKTVKILLEAINESQQKRHLKGKL